MPAAFLFDMDGTIVDTMHTHHQAWVEVLAEQGIDVTIEEAAGYLGGTNAENIVKMQRDFQVEFNSEELSERKETLWRENVRACLEPIDGFLEFIGKTRRMGIRTALVTMAPDPNVRLVLDALHLRKHFDALITAEHVIKGKPDPEGFLRAAKMLESDPLDCIVFEDSRAGIHAAQNAGMRAVLVTTMLQLVDIQDANNIIEVISDYQSIDPSRLLRNSQ